jgi:hypothetical protein
LIGVLAPRVIRRGGGSNLIAVCSAWPRVRLIDKVV